MHHARRIYAASNGVNSFTANHRPPLLPAQEGVAATPQGVGVEAPPRLQLNHWKTLSCRRTRNVSLAIFSACGAGWALPSPTRGVGEAAVEACLTRLGCRR
uniref:Uncharacterized protein n=1 Tax=Cacopsylla melanoneura TaxID=428564 RepID=A0A8D8YTJ2_9HEMI